MLAPVLQENYDSQIDPEAGEGMGVFGHLRVGLFSHIVRILALHIMWYCCVCVCVRWVCADVPELLLPMEKIFKECDPDRSESISVTIILVVVF